MKIRINIDIKVSKLVKFFVISDFFLLAGWGFIDPVFSVFIVQRIAGGTLITVGIAAAIYWILKSVLQIPMAQYLDKTPGEKDDFMTLIGGILLAGISAHAVASILRPRGLQSTSEVEVGTPTARGQDDQTQLQLEDAVCDLLTSLCNRSNQPLTIRFSVHSEIEAGKRSSNARIAGSPLGSDDARGYLEITRVVMN